MGIPVLNMGASGSGKSTGMRNLDRKTTAVFNVAGKPLPFRGKFDMMLTVHDVDEIIKLAGRYDNIFTRVVSAPGLWLQRITTKEPDDDMIEVGIAAVEAVFDWKQYLSDAFGWTE